MNLDTRKDFLTFTGGFLFVMLFITLILSRWAGVPILSLIHWSLADAAFGCGAGLLMVLVFAQLNDLRQQAADALGRSLMRCRWYDLLILAALVGIIEELMFRGFLEQFLGRWNFWGAFVLTNAIFGLLHAVSVQYAIVAAVLGMLLSGLAWGTGEFNLLRPIVAHGVYDFIGFIWIARETRQALDAATAKDDESA